LSVSVIKILRRLNDWFLKAADYLFVFDCIGLSIFIVFNACLRYIFQNEIYGAEDFTLLFAMWLYFVGCAIATYRDDHITADLIHSLLKTDKARYIHNIIRISLGLVFCIIVTKWIYFYFGWCIELHKVTSMLKVPFAFSVFALVVSFTLSCIYQAIQIIQNCQLLKALNHQMAPEGRGAEK